MNKTSNNIRILIEAVLLVVFVAIIILAYQKLKEMDKTNKVVFQCGDNKSITATFYPDNDMRVDLTLSDGRNLILPRVISGSGSRYANPDESIVFWNKGVTAFITENGKDTYNNCAIPGSVNNLMQSVSDGKIAFYYGSDFGLAVTPEQILTKPAYIPPCDQNFNYCLYYINPQYNDTNFESAGFRIKKRSDLTNEKSCLNTPPSGYDDSFVPNSTKSADTYSSSVFSNVGQGAAGHYTTGSLYRLYIKADLLCYEFETRIGESQFANYPAGVIKQFTDTNRDQLKIELTNLLSGITLNGKAILLQ